MIMMDYDNLQGPVVGGWYRLLDRFITTTGPTSTMQINSCHIYVCLFYLLIAALKKVFCDQVCQNFKIALVKSSYLLQSIMYVVCLLQCLFAPCLYVGMIPLIGISQGLCTPEELKNRLTKVTLGQLYLSCYLTIVIIYARIILLCYSLTGR